MTQLHRSQKRLKEKKRLEKSERKAQKRAEKREGVPTDADGQSEEVSDEEDEAKVTLASDALHAEPIKDAGED